MCDAAEQRNGQQAVQDNQKCRHASPAPIAATGKKRQAAIFLLISDAEIC